MASFTRPPASKNVVRAFFDFLKQPHPATPGSQSAVRQLADVGQLLLFAYGLLVLTVLLNYLLVTLGDYEEVQHYRFGELSELFNQETWSGPDQMNAAFIIVSVVLVAPVYEEIAFRLFLRYRLRYLAVSLSLQCLLFLNVFGVFTDGALFVPGMVVLTITAAIITVWVRKNEAYLSHRWHRGFPIIFYSASVAFGLIHCAAYGLEGRALWLAPVMLSPLIITGLVLGFVRVHYGMGYAVLFHAMINTISLTMAFFVLW